MNRFDENLKNWPIKLMFVFSNNQKRLHSFTDPYKTTHSLTDTQVWSLEGDLLNHLGTENGFKMVHRAPESDSVISAFSTFFSSSWLPLTSGTSNDFGDHTNFQFFITPKSEPASNHFNFQHFGVRRSDLGVKNWKLVFSQNHFENKKSVLI